MTIHTIELCEDIDAFADDELYLHTIELHAIEALEAEVARELLIH